tara:strand:+ start:70 stop:426 length:357 start_codon:yes stop_codon:yes gene_type:complete
MRVIILFTFFLAPLFGLASFPIENETTKFINEVSNQTSFTETPWYNKWWVILINAIILVPLTPLFFVGIFGLFSRIALLLSKIKKSSWIRFFKILRLAFIALFLIAAIGLGIIGKHGI